FDTVGAAGHRVAHRGHGVLVDMACRAAVAYDQHVRPPSGLRRSLQWAPAGDLNEEARNMSGVIVTAHRTTNKRATEIPRRGCDTTMHWIFGYGSLIWRPDFAYRQARKAVLRGWQRRFWQASPDHRGVPAAPGRVVTLVEQREASCWGMAFEVAAAEWLSIIAMLDEREKNGYRPSQVSLDLDDGSSVTALTYIAGP